MTRIQWARGSQFNWVFDNMGGTPLQEAAAGNFSGAAAVVAADGTVRLEPPNPGGGQVHFIRGIWRKDALFAWDGFWAAAIGGDTTNFYTGGSFINAGDVTIITLGAPPAPGTEVQLFYLYFTGEQAVKYEALNNYPCIRRAVRGRDDYTYDFAVDRLLDLMVYLHLAERERGLDYDPARRFLWRTFAGCAQSRTSPLVYDSFERQLWERGAFLLYRDSTRGVAGLPVFQTEMAEGTRERVLHVRTDLPTQADGAWFGYGLDWSLETGPFRDIDRLTLKVKGGSGSTRLHNLTKYGSGSAQLILAGDYAHQEKRRFVVMAETTGEVGTATFKWSQDGGLSWEETGVITGDRDHPLPLLGGVEAYWEGGSGTDLIAGDYWTFWGGGPAEHPGRLLACLNDSEMGDADPFGPTHTFVHALPDRFSELTQVELPFSQFWRRDNLSDDGDRVRAAWGTWHSASQPDDSQLTICDREATEALFGDTFHTQRRVAWDLSPYATAFGAWVGIDTARCNSTSRNSLNFLIKPEVAGLSSLTLRVKVKDANGSYFYTDRQVTVNSWQRVSVSLAGMSLESGVLPLTHPIQAADIGIPDSPPSNGSFLVTDLKFDEHLRFIGANRLRLLEFKIEQQGLPEHEWWLDEVGLNLEAEDSYPLAPRLAISLGPYGQNPWRGPTLVHYAQPLAPHVVGGVHIAQTYLNLHRDAQDEFAARYGGVKGPILPVHTRNDLENVALCGEENFGKFCWWGRHRDYGKQVGAWLFNGSLADASGKNHPLTWSAGAPAFTTGVCQPGDTALVFDGTGSHAFHAAAADFLLGGGDFTLEAVAKFADLSGTMALLGVWSPSTSNRSWVWLRQGQSLALAYSTDGVSTFSRTGATAITGSDAYYHLVVTRSGPTLTFYVNGAAAGTADLGSAVLFAAGAPLRLGRTEGTEYGYLNGALDYAAIHNGRAMSALEVAERFQIIQGKLNGSAYPEAGHALGQFWAFCRLAQYFFVTNDEAAWNILQNWLVWIDAHGVAEGSGWNFPLHFSEYGFVYSTPGEAGWFETNWFEDGWFEGLSLGDLTYDPGAAASIALGCQYIYFRNGDQTAATWARRILDDLRLNRQSAEFGGGYKTDYHYSWLNALVAQAFGLAAHGLAGQAYRFPAIPEDVAHFETLLTWMFAHVGDVKPNLLNADLIPFSYLEAQDAWEYAPHYVFMSQMGSMEAVALMAGAALSRGKAGDWTWFEKLVNFVLRDHLVPLATSQIRSLTSSHHLAEGKNVVRVFFADYDRDNSKYCEARDEAAVSSWGEQALDLDCRYGAPVILENPEVAHILAARLLQRLSTPWDAVQVDTWLEGARVELGDILALSSDFHGLEQGEFTLFGKTVDLSRRRVQFDLARPAGWIWAWAGDAEGSGYEAYAIHEPSPYDEHWESRAYAH